MPLSSGDKLGPYEILSAIGAGGMGEVYRAKDTKLGRQVAIKVLPGHLAANASARERLRREASAAAALDHPFICKVFEIGEDRGELFLVMEFISGDTRSEELDRKSTRLNSSHLGISYAVFCLKKKKYESLMDEMGSTHQHAGAAGDRHASD